MTVANSFPSGDLKDRYTAAASILRMPYWDWAVNPTSGEDVVPSSFTSQTIDVIQPNGSATIANPLYSYRFDPTDADGMIYDPVSSPPAVYHSPLNLISTATGLRPSETPQIGKIRTLLAKRKSLSIA